MPEPRASRQRTESRTKLAEHRLSRNLTQKQVAIFSGIPLSSYRRLERGLNPNPPLRWLVNLQHVLALDTLLELLEDDWLEFHQLGPYKPRRPPQREFIRGRSPA